MGLLFPGGIDGLGLADADRVEEGVRALESVSMDLKDLPDQMKAIIARREIDRWNGRLRTYPSDVSVGV